MVRSRVQREYEVQGETAGLSDAARGRFRRQERGPHLLADWVDAVFLDFTIEPEHLQPVVPFRLDLWQGQAMVSLVAFTMRRMRPNLGGKLGEWAFAPIATHQFLNVRTYVRGGGEPGIHFIAEWLNNRMSVLLGPPAFGLPYRLGRLEFANETTPCQGRVTDPAGRQLAYRAGAERGARPRPSTPGSRDAFLRERYTAYTSWNGVRRYFRVWHPPWEGVPLRVDLLRTGLLHPLGDWTRQLSPTGAFHTNGFQDVRMGRPHRFRG